MAWRAALGNAFNKSLIVDLSIQSGSLRQITFNRFDTAEFRCTSFSEMSVGSKSDITVPCSTKRANVIRLSAVSWRPDDEFSATLEFNATSPVSIVVATSLRNEDGSLWQDKRTVQVEKGIAQ